MKAATVVTGCLAGILFLLILSDCMNRADAQLPLHQMLARICTSEAGWDRPDECRAIYSALRNKAEAHNTTLRKHMRRYSGRNFDADRMDRRRWLAFLGAEKPAGWPEAVSWKGWGKPKWDRQLSAARGILKDKRVVCDAHDWGNEGDWANGYDGVVVDCGETLNVFGRPE